MPISHFNRSKRRSAHCRARKKTSRSAMTRTRKPSPPFPGRSGELLLTGDLVQGLDATITRACELYDYFRQNYAGLRGWPQHKLREERVNLHEKAGLCLKFGFKHLAETYRTENEQVSLQFSRLKQILKQAEEPAAAREPRIDDLGGVCPGPSDVTLGSRTPASIIC